MCTQTIFFPRWWNKLTVCFIGELCPQTVISVISVTESCLFLMPREIPKIITQCWLLTLHTDFYRSSDDIIHLRYSFEISLFLLESIILKLFHNLLMLFFCRWVKLCQSLLLRNPASLRSFFYTQPHYWPVVI